MDIRRFTRALERAVEDELNRPYSFGCVSKFTNGSHTDMDYGTFKKSIKSITRDIEKINFGQIRDFSSLRKEGLLIEKNMFEKTGGVNTQMGLIFLLLIAGYAYVNKLLFDPEGLRDFTKDLLADYKNIKNASFYKNLGLKDIRYYPLRGFKDIYSFVKIYQEKNLDDTLLTIYLISKVDDTTSLNRANLKTLRLLQKWAGEIFCSYQQGEDIKTQVEKLNAYYVRKNISSGGVADIFSLTKTIYYLKENPCQII